MLARKYEIQNQKNKGGRGLFAKVAFAKDEKVYDFHPALKPRATRTSVQVGMGQHAEGIDNANDFLNHSCDPNVWIDTGSLCVRALRPIQADEELTFNYLTTEWELHSPFQCGCGSKKCFGKIGGFGRLDRQGRDRLRPLAAPHVIAMAQELAAVPAAARRA